MSCVLKSGYGKSVLYPTSYAKDFPLSPIMKYPLFFYVYLFWKHMVKVMDMTMNNLNLFVNKKK